METDLDYLMAGKVGHCLPPDELAHINKRIAKEPEVKAKWEEFIAALPKDAVECGFSFLHEPGYWNTGPGSIQYLLAHCPRWGPAKWVYRNWFLLRRYAYRLYKRILRKIS